MAILSFESLHSTHAEPLFPALSDQRLYAYIPEDPPSSVEDLAAKFSRLERGPASADEQWYNWVMLAGPESVGTLQVTVQPDGVALIAFVVFVEHQGKGYAAEGCRWLVDWLFQMKGVALIRALIDTRNVPSIRLAEALGLQRVSIVTDADHFKGTSSDEFVYELPAAEIYPLAAS